jgi:hypothetical protein
MPEAFRKDSAESSSDSRRVSRSHVNAGMVWFISLRRLRPDMAIAQFSSSSHFMCHARLNTCSLENKQCTFE